MNLPFIPSSTNFSDLTEDGVNEVNGKVDELMGEERGIIEEEIFTMLTVLTDREKIMFLFQILRGDGYKLKYDRCAKVIGVDRSWYMCLLKDMRQKLADFANKEEA